MNSRLTRHLYRPYTDEYGPNMENRERVSEKEREYKKENSLFIKDLYYEEINRENKAIFTRAKKLNN